MYAVSTYYILYPNCNLYYKYKIKIAFSNLISLVYDYKSCYAQKSK